MSRERFDAAPVKSSKFRKKCIKTWNKNYKSEEKNVKKIYYNPYIEGNLKCIKSTKQVDSKLSLNKQSMKSLDENTERFHNATRKDVIW